jgi:acetyl esterase
MGDVIPRPPSFCGVMVTGLSFLGDTRREFAEGYFLEGPLMSWAGTHYLPSGVDINDPRLSPLRAPNLSGLPPALIHTGGFDLLRDEGQAYADALRSRWREGPLRLP